MNVIGLSGIDSACDLLASQHFSINALRRIGRNRFRKRSGTEQAVQRNVGEQHGHQAQDGEYFLKPLTHEHTLPWIFFMPVWA